MSNTCEQAMKVWVQTVDQAICDVKAVEDNAFKYDDDGYKPRHNTECSGAYWALRSMVRDERAYVDTYKRMEEYFNSKCMSMVAAFYQLSDDGYQD